MTDKDKENTRTLDNAASQPLQSNPEPGQRAKAAWPGIESAKAHEKSVTERADDEDEGEDEGEDAIATSAPSAWQEALNSAAADAVACAPPPCSHYAS